MSESTPTPQRRAWLGLVIKTLLAGVILFIVFSRLETKELLAQLAHCQGFYLALAFLAYGLTTVLSIARWHLLLRECATGIKIQRTAELTMIGLFGNAFMLGSMGGDVLKAFYATRESPQNKPAVVMSIVMERLLGFIGMFLLSTTLILTRYHLLTSDPATRVVVYLYFGLMGIVLLLVAVGSMKQTADWAKNLPLTKKLGWVELIRQADEAYRFFLGHKLCFFGGLALSLLAHISLMATFFMAGSAVGLEAGFWDLCAVLPLVNLVTLLPITPSGIGVREYAFKHFLSILQVSQETSVALSLMGFLVILTWNLFGGVIYLAVAVRKVAHSKQDTTNLSASAETIKTAY